MGTQTLLLLSSSISPSHLPLPRTKSSSFSLRKRLRLVSALPSTRLDAFWGWLRREGVVTAKTPATPALVPEGIGLVATRYIGRNEVVIEVPKKLWINPDTVAESEIGNVCAGLKPWVGVALFLLRERKMGEESSKWRHYMEILPESTDSTVFCAGQKRS